MSSIYNTKLQARLASYCKEVGGQAKAAANIKVSTSIVSQYLRSGYHEKGGDIANTEIKLSEFFGVQDARNEQASKTAPERMEQMLYVPTNTSEHVYKSIRYTQLEKGIAMLYGDAGIGKTMAARKFVKDFPTTAIYMRVTPVTGVLSRFIRKLAGKLHIASNRDIGQLEDAIRDKLMGTNIVLVIDEGQDLKFSTMEWLRALCDYDDETGKQGIGIALIGNERMYTRMQTRKDNMYSQQFNRSRPQRYHTRMCTKKDVEQIFPALVRKSMKQEIEFLYSICQSKWALRGAVAVYVDAVNHNDVSLKRLQDISHRLLSIGVA